MTVIRKGVIYKKIEYYELVEVVTTRTLESIKAAGFNVEEISIKRHQKINYEVIKRVLSLARY